MAVLRGFARVRGALLPERRSAGHNEGGWILRPAYPSRSLAFLGLSPIPASRARGSPSNDPDTGGRIRRRSPRSALAVDYETTLPVS